VTFEENFGVARNREVAVFDNVIDAHITSVLKRAGGFAAIW
jgi:hypothetical protein